MPHNPLHHDEVVVLMFQNLARGEVRPEGPNVPKSDPDQDQAETQPGQAETQVRSLQVEQLVSSGWPDNGIPCIDENMPNGIEMKEEWPQRIDI